MFASAFIITNTAMRQQQLLMLLQHPQQQQLQQQQLQLVFELNIALPLATTTAIVKAL